MSKTVELARHLETLHINNMYKSDFYWTWDKSDEEIESEREDLIAIAKAVYAGHGEVEVIDSFFKGGLDVPAGAKAPLYYLSKSLELLATADVVIFAEDWREARGCRIEHECADGYGVARIELPEEG